MTENELKLAADKLFWRFEQEKFEYEGQYCYATELVFAFADYVDKLNDDFLYDFLQTEDDKEVRRFRDMLQKGVDSWLQKNVKTMLIM